jgi:hypothetical protein
VRHVPGDEDEVERTVADDLVGDVDVAATRVLGLGTHGGSFARSQWLGRVSSRWCAARRGTCRSDVPNRAAAQTAPKRATMSARADSPRLNCRLVRRPSASVPVQLRACPARNLRPPPARTQAATPTSSVRLPPQVRTGSPRVGRASAASSKRAERKPGPHSVRKPQRGARFLPCQLERLERRLVHRRVRHSHLRHSLR